MSQIVSKYSVKEKSDKVHFLPQPHNDDFLYYLTSVGHEYLNRSYYMERKDSDVYMIDYVVRGKGHLSCGNGKSFTLREGDLCFVYLGEPSIFYPMGDDFEIYFFHVKGAQIKELYQAFVHNAGNVIGGFSEKLAADSFSSIRERIDAGPDFKEISIILYRFLLEILERSQRQKDAYPPFIMKIFQKIIDHGCTVQQLAEELGFHAVYLERQFKRYTKKTLRRFLTERKLSLAENLLLTTDLTINEIAQRIGYADSNGLISLFRTELHCTPLAFRKKRGSIEKTEK